MGQHTASVTIDASGQVHLCLSLWDTGTGAHTIMRHMVAETLTLPTQLALRAVVAELLEGPLESLQLSQGRFVMPGNPATHPLRDGGRGATLSTTGGAIRGAMSVTSTPPHVTAFCALATEVEVNPDTGQVTVTKVVTAHDSARSCIP